MIQSEILSRPRRPLYPLIHLRSSTTAAAQFNIHCSLNGFGGFASQWLQAPNQSNLGRKSWTESSWEKNPFFLGNRTLFNSRASPRCWRRLRLRPHTLHQGDVLKRDTIGSLRKLGRVGWAQARPALPSSHPALSLSLECSPLLAPSRAATPLCPENGRYHSTSISY